MPTELEGLPVSFQVAGLKYTGEISFPINWLVNTPARYAGPHRKDCGCSKCKPSKAAIVASLVDVYHVMLYPETKLRILDSVYCSLTS